MIDELVATVAPATLDVMIQTIDLDPNPYGANAFQSATAILFAVLVIVGSSLFVRYWSSLILDDEEADHAHSITKGLRTYDRNKIRITYDELEDDVSRVRSRIRSLFDDDFTTDVPSLVGALREVRHVWVERRRAALGAVSDELPALSRALSLDAVLYLLFGLVVHESLGTWSALFTASSTPPTPREIADRLVAAGSSSVDILVDLVSSFPFAGEIWSFVLLGAIESGRFVFENVILVAGILLAGSIVIWYLDRLVANDVEPRLYRTKPRAAIGVFAILVCTWVAGVGFALLAKTIFGTVGVESLSSSASLWGSVVGLLASLAVASVLARRELRATYGRLTAAYEQADEQGVGPAGTVGYIIVRKVFGVIGVFAAAVIPIFVFQALTSGKLASIISVALFESSTQVRLTIALAGIAFLFFVVIQTRPAWGELLGALRVSLDRKGLRLVLLTRAFPLLVLVLAYPMALGSGFFDPISSIGVAVGVALVVKLLLWLHTKAELAYYELERPELKPSRVWVEAVVVEDALDREIAVVSTNGKSIAAPVEPLDGEDGLPAGGLDELVDQVVADSKMLFENAERRPSLYAYYFERIKDGAVDFEKARREYLGSISKAIDAEVDKAGRHGVELERLDEIMSDRFDEELYRRTRRRKQKKHDGIAIYGDRVKSN